MRLKPSRMWIVEKFTKGPRKRRLGALVSGSVELTMGAIDNESRDILLEQGPKSATTPKTRMFRQRLQSLLRSIKLTLLAHILVIRSDTERPKVAVHRNRGMVFLHSLLHVPPLFGAITLIVLNFTNFFYTYGPYDSTGLQFVAKLHELLMQASISAILLDLIRRLAFTSHLPFGFLFAPTHTSTVSYLWSLDYWSAVSASAVSWRLRLVTGLFAFFAIALAALVGPSSAVVMLPRLITSARDFSTTELLLERSPSATFPSTLTSGSNFTLPPMFLIQIASLSITPQLGSLQNLDWDLVVQENLTYADYWPFSSKFTVLLEETEFEFPKGLVFMPGTELGARLIMQYYRDINFGSNLEILSHTDAVIYSVEASHAAVSVRCNSQFSLEPNDTTTKLQLPNYNGTGTVNFGSLADLKDDYERNWMHGTHWVLAPADSEFSLVALIYSETEEAGKRTSNNIDVHTCGVRATWEPARYELRGTSEMRTVQSTPLHLDRPWQASQISMSMDWVHQLNYIMDTEGGIATPKPFKEFVATDPADRVVTPSELYLATIVAKAVASTYNTTWEVPYICSGPYAIFADCQQGETCPLELDIASTSCDNLKTEVRVSGYGYGITGATVILSLLVLFLYCTLVLAYLVTVLIRGETSTALDSPAELVALALQSKHPKHLGNTSVGIETMATFRAPVGIRVNTEDGFELVFKDDSRPDSSVLTKVESNKAY
ncbi:hypothetical protein BDV96DRAFT_328299 [Lophiotrema nucula]|uniref:Uncharacterized protein n=1 Tax=Lophiotrema nucula TaxID=690887 RepID=A0A6A5YJZ3_9PLEO|nr:hypothetical protein BDV96DRAFT_328299 [Lophiotrema nucula]